MDQIHGIPVATANKFFVDPFWTPSLKKYQGARWISTSSAVRVKDPQVPDSEIFPGCRDDGFFPDGMDRWATL